MVGDILPGFCALFAGLFRTAVAARRVRTRLHSFGHRAHKKGRDTIRVPARFFTFKRRARNIFCI